jgi:nickel superoxide dismutase
MMNTLTRKLTVSALLLSALALNSLAHCQIPCGIFDDQMRIHLMEEHVTTIEKSMKQIDAAKNQNQAVRWVLNKEQHADELSEIVTYYFMAQRIKPGAEDYVLKLTQLHEILIHAMKAKQSTDLAVVEKLRELIHQFEHSYLGEAHQH